MRKALFILLALSAPALANGPKYNFEDPKLNDELTNVYFDIRNVANKTYKASSMTVAGITIDSETVKYKLTVPNGSASTDAAAFGQMKVVQIRTGTSTSIFSTTSATFQQTNLSAAITPTSASNNVLIIACGSISTANGANSEVVAGIQRGTTDLTSSVGEANGLTASAIRSMHPACIVWLDSPATTSATTYFATVKNTDGVTSVSFGRTNAQQFMLLMETTP